MRDLNPAARIGVLLALFAVSCDRGRPERTGAAKEASSVRAVDATAKKSTTPTGASDSGPPLLFDVPPFELLDQSGAAFGNSDLTGTVWVIHFLPAHSIAGRAPLLEQLAAFQQGRLLRWPDAERVRFLSIAADAERDSPAAMQGLARRFNIDPQRWRFVTGEQDALDAIRNGFSIPPSDSDRDGGADAGPPRLFLADAQGRIRGDYDAESEGGLDRLRTDLRTVLSEAVPGSSGILHVGNPQDVFDPDWMEERRADQLAGRDQIAMFHDFAFEDRLLASGITFVNRAVADAARDFKSNHYDHANGLAAADVDGDGLTDLYFTSQVGGNQLWRNRGEGRFEEITAEAGVGLAGRVSVSASFADTDNDGDADLFVTTTRHGNVFFENAGGGTFRDVTAASGLEFVGHSSAGDFFDYNGDGLLDLLLTNVGVFTTEEIGYSGHPEQREDPYYIGVMDAFVGHLHDDRFERCVLYRNEGGNRFRDVSEEAALVGTGWAGDATPIDANRDGRLDLYVLDMQGNDDFYLNQEGRRFEKADAEAFPRSVWGGMGVKSFDYDNDGLMDLFVTNMHADMWQLKQNILGPDEKRKPPAGVMPESYLQSRDPGANVLGNGLYRNLGDGTFEEISDATGAETYWPWGLSVGDLNADGWQDAFITACMNYPFRYHPNSLLLNDQGRTFRDAEFILGVEPRRGGRTATPWYELDCSGRDANHELCQGRNGPVAVWGALGSRSSVVFDLEGDGDLDIVTNDFNSEPMVLVSDLAARKPDLHYLAVRLQGASSNRDGLGATVRITRGGRTLTQVHDGQSGYLSQSALPLYFGLGESDVVDEINVEWLGGNRQTISGPIETNRTLDIVETQAVVERPL